MQSRATVVPVVRAGALASLPVTAARTKQWHLTQQLVPYAVDTNQSPITLDLFLPNKTKNQVSLSQVNLSQVSRRA